MHLNLQHEAYINYKITNSPIVMIGGEQNIDGGCIPSIDSNKEYENKFFDTGGIKWGLDTNGLYIGFSQTGLNYTKTTEKDIEWNNIGLHKGVYVGSRVAFLSVIYNFLINDIIKDPVFGIRGFGDEFYLFFNELNQKYEGNYFKQFLKVKSLEELYENPSIKSGEVIDLIKVKDHVISFSNYLKAYKESLKKDFKEISEVWVYNEKSSKHDKVDFDKLIELSIEKEKKILAERLKNENDAAEQTNIKLSPKEYYEELLKKFEEKLERYTNEAPNNTEETNNIRSLELQEDYKKLQIALREYESSNNK